MDTPKLELDTADELYAAVGFRITRIRKARGLTQEFLARAVGLTRSSIANTETGRQRIPLHVLLAIAQALGVDMIDLLDTGRELPSLANLLPDNAHKVIEDTLGDIEVVRRSLAALADKIRPLANINPTTTEGL